MLPLLISLMACGSPPPESAPLPAAAEETAPPEPVGPAALPWLSQPELSKAGLRISEVLPPPYEAQRLDADAFGQWLRQRTVAHADAPVLAHSGHEITKWAPYRVVQLPMVEGDLQQCADAIIRLRAEWKLETGQEVSFYATSGDPIPWERYREGEVPFAVGNKLIWRPGRKGDWDGYLTKVFTWAGSYSLQELETQPATQPRAGMILVRGGFPGHAVLIMDVARQGDDLYFLVGQSFMPAQSFHLDLGPHAGWWLWQDNLSLGSWSFSSSDLREWK